jgi:hypothetical protein
MKIAFSRWICVDGVVLARDHLDPRNADCGGASRFIAEAWRSGFETGAQRLDCPMARLGDADPE